MTIDQLMEGKAPGSIKIACADLERWFQPFYKNKAGTWFGLEGSGFSVSFSNDFQDWYIYTEPKPTKVVYEWLLLEDDQSWTIDGSLMGEKEAKEYYDYMKVPSYKKTGREFVVECE